MTDEMLFYGGAAFALVSLITAVIWFSVSQVRKVRLSAQLDKEYGEEKKN